MTIDALFAGIDRHAAERSRPPDRAGVSFLGRPGFGTPSPSTFVHMSLAAKVTTGAAVLVVGGLVALAVPAIVSIGQAAHGTVEGVGNLAEPLEASPESVAEAVVPEPTPTPRDAKQAAAWAIGCDDFGLHPGYGGSPVATYPRPDRGPSEYAQGTVTLDDEGNVKSYTVAPGDSGMSIGERFCIDYVSLLAANNAWPTLQPGKVLVISPYNP